MDRKPEPKPWPRSPVYDVPNIGRRVEGRGAIIRGQNNKWEDAIIGAGMSAAEMERQAIELARDKGVPQNDYTIEIETGELP